jgi:hypothetical protein
MSSVQLMMYRILFNFIKGMLSVSCISPKKRNGRPLCLSTRAAIFHHPIAQMNTVAVIWRDQISRIRKDRDIENIHRDTTAVQNHKDRYQTSVISRGRSLTLITI